MNNNNDLMKTVRNGTSCQKMKKTKITPKSNAWKLNVKKQINQDCLNKTFHSAIRQDNNQIVQQALKQGAEINSLNEQKLTPLFCAVEKENELIIELLLSKGASLHGNEYGVTPLHIAVEKGAIEITKQLLKAGAAVNSVCDYYFRECSSKPLSLDIDIFNILHIVDLVPLHIAAAKGFCHIIEILCNYGADVNLCTNYECTPLHFAVANDQKECIIMLLKYGAYIDVRNITDETPIHIATEKNLLPIVELLLKNGSFINSKNSEGFTALHRAVALRYMAIIRLLLLHNADVNCCANNKTTPLLIAMKLLYNSATVKLLIDHGADVNVQDQDGNTILNLAVSRGDTSMVDAILKHSTLDMNNESNKRSLKIAFMDPPSINVRIIQSLFYHGFTVKPEDINTESLRYVVMKGYDSILENLLEQNQFFTRALQDIIPLHVAVKDRNYSITKLLLFYVTDIDATDTAGKPPIYYSIETSNIEMTRLLLESGADVKGWPELLIIATRNVCVAIVEMLLKNQVNTEATDEFGRTALHLTAINEFKPYSYYKDDGARTEIARLLLRYKANVNAKTKSCGISTLHLACINNYIKIVKLLIEYKADIEICLENIDHDNISNILGSIYRDPISLRNAYNLLQNGQTPLHVAAKGRNKLISQLLLNEGASTCCKDIKGSTPLHVAAGEINFCIVRRLILKGAKIDEKDNEGQTALHIACKWGKENNVKFLLRIGADINVETYNNQLPIDLALIFYYSTEHYPYYGNNEPRWEVGHAIMRMLKYHLIMFRTAGFYVSEKNQLSLMNCDTDNIEWYTNKCKIEITKLKIHKFGNKLVGYDILTKNTSSLAKYFRNYDTFRNFNENKYPIYGRMVFRNARKCNDRISLIDSSHRFFEHCIELPYVCAEKILNYLDDKDLQNVIDLCKTLRLFEMDIDFYNYFLFIKNKTLNSNW